MKSIMIIASRCKLALCAALLVTAAAFAVSAQTSIFTYQGRLTDGVNAANGTYQMTFSLFGSLAGNDLIGSTITNNTVAVSNGTFTVQLDFSPATPFATGANRWLEIAVRKPTDPPGFTTLTPRQQITSLPYSIRTLSATTADSAPAGTLTGTTLNSTVTGSSLTGVGTLGSLTVTNPIAGSVTGNAANVTGTVAVANGGTGAASAGGARTNLGLGTLATLSPTGTANSTTFLRGDNAWAVPTAGVNNTFFNGFANSSLAGDTFMSLSGGTSPQATLGPVANLMAGPCTFDAFRVAATLVSGAPDTLNLTLLKNGVATTLTTGPFTVSTVGTTVFISDTVDSFAVVAGETVSIRINQTTGVPTVRMATTVHCQ